MLHTLCEYGECSSNRSGVIALTSCYDLKGHGHDLEDDGHGHPWIMNRVLAHNMMHNRCKYGECSLNRSGVFALTNCFDLEGQS